MGYYATLTLMIAVLIVKFVALCLSVRLMWQGIMAVWLVNGWVAAFWTLVIMLLNTVSFSRKG